MFPSCAHLLFQPRISLGLTTYKSKQKVNDLPGLIPSEVRPLFLLLPSFTASSQNPDELWETEDSRVDGQTLKGG